MLVLLFQISIIDMLYNKKLVPCMITFDWSSYETCHVIRPKTGIIDKYNI